MRDKEEKKMKVGSDKEWGPADGNRSDALMVACCSIFGEQCETIYNEQSRNIMQNDIFTILDQVMRLNRDNGKRFMRTDRLDEIQRLLWDGRYRRVNPQGLFHLYAKRPFDRIEGPAVLVSSHVDCEAGITRCFCEDAGDGLLRGTFDNAATNAAVLSLMLEDALPDSVLVAFTGDEEDGSRGIAETVEFLRSKNVQIDLAVVLDVTDMGWKEEAGFTVENNFWDDARGRRVIERVGRLSADWRFVPEDPDDIPDYVPPDRVIPSEAEADESWELDEMDVSCFSLCLPVRGNMHSDRGVLARRASFDAYRSALSAILADR